MTDFQVSDCTPKMIAAVANGCGAQKGWQSWIRPPQGHARIHCDRHDIRYRRGGTWKDRQIADRELLAGLLSDMRQMRWWQQPGFFLKAYLYYAAVRIFGRYDWHHLPEPRSWEWFREQYDPTAPIVPPSLTTTTPRAA